MRKIVLLFIVLFALTDYSKAQVLDTIKPATGIDDAFFRINHDGTVYSSYIELDSLQIKAIKTSAINLVEEFNDYVAKLWRPWTEEYKFRYTPQELDDFKNEIEDAARSLFYANAESFYTHETAEYRVYRLDGVDYYLDQFGRQRKAIGETYIDDYGVRRIKVEEDVLHHPVQIVIAPSNNKSERRLEVKKYLNNIKNSHLYDRVVFDSGAIIHADNLVQDQPGRYVGTVCYYQDFEGIRGDGMPFRDRTYRCVTYYVYVDMVDGMILWKMELGDIRVTVIK